MNDKLREFLLETFGRVVTIVFVVGVIVYAMKHFAK